MSANTLAYTREKAYEKTIKDLCRRRVGIVQYARALCASANPSGGRQKISHKIAARRAFCGRSCVRIMR